jgi:hypothetical protein
MIYEWIDKRDYFRVKVPNGRAAAALLQMIRRFGTPYEEETFLRTKDEPEDGNRAVVYISPLNELERYNIEQALDLINTITD